MRALTLGSVALILLASPAFAQYGSSNRGGYGSGGYSTGSNPNGHSADGYTTNRGTYVQPHQSTNPNGTHTTTMGPGGIRTRTPARARLRGSLFAALALTAGPALAQTITDSDTLKQGGVTYRLWGMDSPLAQTCPDGWPAGRIAATRLQELTAGRPIVCQEKDRDRYGRTVAICRASGEDLGAVMVREGLAWAFTRFSVDYADQQEEARRANRGVHEHDCQPAWEWRAQKRR